jgi:hypothetical protein
MALVTFQMTVLQKQAARAEQEMKDIKDKHERELRHERDKNSENQKIIEQERRKNELLKEELKIYEENILQGMAISGSTMTNNSHKESPNSPKHKRIKIVEEESSDKSEQSSDKLPPKDNSSDEVIKIKKEVEQDKTSELKLVPMYIDDNGKFHYNQSTAYTTSARDKSNILIATKDPEAIRSGVNAISTEPKPKALDSHLIKHQPRVPTNEEIRRSLESWRALLRSTKDYYPDKSKTPEQHLVDLKFLMGARGSFNKFGHNNPIARLQWKHQEYGSLQRQYFIPDDYMAPDTYFEILHNPGGDEVVYYKRCCSVLDYYVMLSEDNPQYKPLNSKVSKRPNPRDYRPKNIAHNPFLSSDKAPSDKWG